MAAVASDGGSTVGALAASAWSVWSFISMGPVSTLMGTVTVMGGSWFAGKAGSAGTGVPALQRPPEGSGADVEDQHDDDQHGSRSECDLIRVLPEPFGLEFPDVDRQRGRRMERAPGRAGVGEVEVQVVVVEGR